MTDEEKKKLSHGDTIAMAVMLHEEQQANRWSAPISQTTGMRMAWELMMLLSICFLAIWVPFDVSFRPKYTDLEKKCFFYVHDFIFFLDLMLTFNTSYISSTGEPILDRISIAKRYVLKGWFIWDVIVLIPYYEIAVWVEHGSDFVISNGASGILKGIRFGRVLRILRLFSLIELFRTLRVRPELWRWLQFSRYGNLLKLGRVILLMFLTVHYLACLWNGTFLPTLSYFK